MRFSDNFSVTKKPADDWFDPFLTKDTDLFIDSFLLREFKWKPLNCAYYKALDFLQVIFNMTKSSKSSCDSELFLKAVELLNSGEFANICLGYTEKGTNGYGFNKKLACDLAKSMCISSMSGLSNLHYLEDMCLFQDQIGPDRASDFLAGIIRQYLIEYTETVCTRHPIITTQDITLLKLNFTENSQVWTTYSTKLPINPYDDKFILLVPKKILRSSSTIDCYGFWRFCWNKKMSELRKAFPRGVKRKETKKKITEFARNHPLICEEFIEECIKTMKPEPYDFILDPKNINTGYEKAKEFVQDKQISGKISSIAGLINFINEVAKKFKIFIEEQNGWERLWITQKNPVSEQSVQNLFYGILSNYCQTKEITFSPGYKAGKGTLLFTTSNGQKHNSFLRVKLVKNIKLTSINQTNLEKELTTERCKSGFYIVVFLRAYTDEEKDSFKNVLKKANTESKTNIKPMVINGRFGGVSQASQ